MSDIIHALQQASANLWFPSESEYPVIPFEWLKDAPAPTSAADFLSAKNLAGDTPIQTLDFDEFFARRTELRDDQDDGQRETARKIQGVVDVLRSHLSDFHIYKVGKILFDIYVLGKDAEGQWYGVSTQVVET